MQQAAVQRKGAAAEVAEGGPEHRGRGGGDGPADGGEALAAVVLDVEPDVVRRGRLEAVGGCLVPEHQKLVRRKEGHGREGVLGPPLTMVVKVAEPALGDVEEDEGVRGGEALEGSQAGVGR